MDLKNKHSVVVGLGRSGVSMAGFLVTRGASVTVTDNRPPEELQNVLPALKALGVAIELGRHEDATFENADLIVLSPGVPHTIGPVVKAKAKGVPVIGEIELAYRFLRTPILAITGTNGKSTVTELLGDMLQRSGFNVLTGGNLGTPLVEFIDQQDGIDFIVAEISSFQLDTIDRFRPRVSVILNITDDHLERYADFDEYARSKARIFENQAPHDICIINAADPAILAVSKNLTATKFAFNCAHMTDNRAWIDRRTLWFHTPDDGDRAVDCSEIPLKGKHNLENIAAAGLATLAVGGTIAAVESALKVFKGLHHRVEYVDTKNGVAFYDDSKATNVDAVVRALESFSGPVVLIMGGRDKGGSYESLKPRMARCVKQLIVMGEAAEKIASVFKDMVPVVRAGNMGEAVRLAAKTAVSGDTVLLSPACSSFDMYTSYAQRGDDFVRSIAQLTGR
ncbi:MAG: UDP-N-acetylmuramoyl-L-alanine--D-glutamate ligase [Desulfosalsimonadaceae bacterium]